MRNSAKGGMQSARSNYSIYCQKCGKPAARMIDRNGEIEYLHYTKKGSALHVVSVFERKEAHHEH